MMLRHSSTMRRAHAQPESFVLGLCFSRDGRGSWWHGIFFFSVLSFRAPSFFPPPLRAFSLPAYGSPKKTVVVAINSHAVAEGQKREGEKREEGDVRSCTVLPYRS
jgi:hypothetical protein